MNDIVATPISFFPSCNIFSLFFCLYFLSFEYSVFGIVCMIFFVDLFYGNKSSSRKKMLRNRLLPDHVSVLNLFIVTF